MNHSSAKPSTILVVDDDEMFRRSIVRVLGALGYDTSEAASGEDAIISVRGAAPDVVVTDLQMPGIDGLELIRQLRQMNPTLPILMLSAHGGVTTAVEAMKLGACDFLAKPVDAETLRLRIEQNIRSRPQMGRLSEIVTSKDSPTMVGISRRMREVFALVEVVKDNRSSVLIYGESGTGKEGIARAIHFGGPWRDKPFVAVNCGALTPTLMESELFGHVKGAYTGAVSDGKGYFRTASGGTLFLDEITELEAALQVKLLRAIQEHEVVPVGASQPIAVDVRIVAATNHDLTQALRQGKLREDLFYRLNVVTVRLPPLRDRREDIPLLASFFIGRLAKVFRQPEKEIDADAMDLLLTHHWPGNVRELENVIERTFATSKDLVIRREHLAHFEQFTAAAVLAPPQPSLPPGGGPTESPRDHVTSEELARLFPAETIPTLEEAERILISRALDASGGVKTAAARLLQIDRQRLYRKMKRYGLKGS
ncbi:MAG: sigma-54-dependent Fis family transcriptional regulator [Deltaproteobacteria bacterium]|nr:sigma-54-dependent Fis family transcriptional regulator [Deltaproteobacteria bacterium]